MHPGKQWKMWSRVQLLEVIFCLISSITVWFRLIYSEWMPVPLPLGRWTTAETTKMSHRNQSNNILGFGHPKLIVGGCFWSDPFHYPQSNAPFLTRSVASVGSRLRHQFKCVWHLRAVWNLLCVIQGLKNSNCLVSVNRIIAHVWVLGDPRVFHEF